MTRSYIGAANLTGCEGLVVKMNASAQVLKATSGTTGAQDVVGIIAPYGGNDAGQPTTVAGPGCTTFGITGAVLTPGTHRLLTVNASSQLIPAVNGSTAIAEWIGQANGAAAIGDLVEVRVCRVIMPPAA